MTEFLCFKNVRSQEMATEQREEFKGREKYITWLKIHSEM
jgi:hypothetical protein